MAKKFEIIKMGAKGPVVQEICRLLIKSGSTMKPTKVFHIGMQAAVFSFQRRNGLPQTGYVDKKTWDKLQALKTQKPAKKTAKK